MIHLDGGIQMIACHRVIQSIIDDALGKYINDLK